MLINSITPRIIPENNKFHVAVAPHLKLWVETFGSASDPAVLLIFGGISPCIFWTDEFCQRMAQLGLFVIRYDHRDTGRSQNDLSFEEAPYSLEDLSDDALSILDFLKIQKAHIFGLSMGGLIGAFLTTRNPGRILSLTVMASSSSFKPLLGEMDNLQPNLPKPRENYLNWLLRNSRMVELPHYSKKMQEENFMECWEILNGNQASFPQDLYRTLVRRAVEMGDLQTAGKNHFRAMFSSLQTMKRAWELVEVPTLIFEGTEDPVFPKGHADSLVHTIRGSKKKTINGMGHNLNPVFYDEILQEFYFSLPI